MIRKLIILFIKLLILRFILLENYRIKRKVWEYFQVLKWKYFSTVLKFQPENSSIYLLFWLIDEHSCDRNVPCQKKILQASQENFPNFSRKFIILSWKFVAKSMLAVCRFNFNEPHCIVESWIKAHCYKHFSLFCCIKNFSVFMNIFHPFFRFSSIKTKFSHRKFVQHFNWYQHSLGLQKPIKKLFMSPKMCSIIEHLH